MSARTRASVAGGTGLRAAALASFLVVAGGTAMAQDVVSIWSGIYTPEQAERGAAVYGSVCARCHGIRGNGAGDPEMQAAPPVARSTFLNKWDGSDIATLHAYVRDTMPTDNPASLTDQEYLDAIVHMLVLSDAPAGEAELPLDPDALADVVIEPKG